MGVAALIVVIGAATGKAASATAPQPAVTSAGPAAAAAPFIGGTAGCTVNDPTSDGCLTPTTAHALEEIGRQFGGYRAGPKIGSAGCWDRHAWNPTSDHPKGRACDFSVGPAGVFPSGAPLDAGWELANWLRANAEPLQIRYVIWQGRIWQADSPADANGWGHRYSGGGIYDPRDATGGHFDHVHVSFNA